MAEDVFLPSAVVVGKNADARGTEAVKLSVKWLSGLTLIALVAIAVVGLSHSASAAADGKVYVTNKASKLTTEGSGKPAARTTASTVFGTYASAVTTGTSARDIVADSDVFIVTVVDSDLNTTSNVTANAAAGAGFISGTADATYVTNVAGTGFDAAGERIQLTLADEAANPVVGTASSIKVLKTGTNTTISNISVTEINFAGNATNPAIITLQLDFGAAPTTNLDIQYPTSASETITVSIKSVVDTTATAVLTLSETGRDTGRFEGEVQVLERTASFTTGTTGDKTTSTAATIPAVGGPITVTYIDAVTSGTAKKVSRTGTLTIDVTVPTATISTPASGSETQNRLPTFTGTVTDNQSGLDVSAFALHVDPSTDTSTKGNSPAIVSSGASNAGLPTIVAASAASIDVSALSDGAATINFSHAQSVVLPNTGVTNPDHVVDFQVVAVDLAGNYGYSDSDTAKGNIESSGRHGNQPHTIKIDQIIPQISLVETGIGLNTAVTPSADKVNVRDTIKVTFDGKVKDTSVSASDFSVIFSGAGGTFVPASIAIKNAVVYLDLDTTIPSNNKPTIRIIGTIQDLAGNSTDAGSKLAVDKLAPVITVTQSGGSGTGTAATEDADSLTNDKMTITVTSDENLQAPPAISVTDIKSDLTALSTAGNVNNGTLGVAQGSNTWALVVTKGSSASGSRAVWVVSTDSAGNAITTGDAISPYTKGYSLDLAVTAPGSSPGATTTQAKPFFTTDYGGAGETSSITITSATLDAVDVTADVVASADSKTFFYQPTTALTNAKHTYIVKAVDAAGNKLTTTTATTKSDRTDFVLTLFAGWNSASVPSNPIDTDISSALSNTGIKQVVAYDATTPSQPWRIASKVGSADYASQTTPGLSTVEAGPGYWIETENFEDQKIPLEGETGPGDARPGLTTIATGNGWNLVGVVDQSRTQTQKGNKGTTLTRPNNVGTATAVSVGTYFNTVNNGRAYVFDTVTSKFRELITGNPVTIGTGIWVFISPQDNGQLPPIVP